MGLRPIYSWTRSDLRRLDLRKLLELPNVRESPFYDKLRGDRVRCALCHRGCTLHSGQVGACGVRFNVDGRLYTITYGLLSAVESRPMEIKPFFHFYPRTSAITISTWGCTFPCAWCQNWALSKRVPQFSGFVEPDRIVRWALEIGDSGVNVSFNEPTLLAEYSMDVFRIARERGLHCSFKTNGYMTERALRALRESGLEGMSIDVKGYVETYRRWLLADFERYWSTVRLSKALGIHVELVYLVIPGVNDHEVEDVVEKTIRDLGDDTPLHLTRFHPDHLLTIASHTPISLLEDLVVRARRMGLKYVYVGNVPGNKFENTYCPSCGEVVIKRFGMHVVKVRLERRDGRYLCPRCGTEISVRGYVGGYGKIFSSPSDSVLNNR